MGAADEAAAGAPGMHELRACPACVQACMDDGAAACHAHADTFCELVAKP